MNRNSRINRKTKLALITILALVAISTTACFPDNIYRPEQRPYDPDMPRQHEEMEPRHEEPRHEEPEPWEPQPMEPEHWEPEPMPEPWEMEPVEPMPMPIAPEPGNDWMTPEEWDCWENNFDFEGSEGLESIPGWTPDQGPVNPSWFEGQDC